MKNGGLHEGFGKLIEVIVVSWAIKYSPSDDLCISLRRRTTFYTSVCTLSYSAA